MAGEGVRVLSEDQSTVVELVFDSKSVRVNLTNSALRF